MVNDFDNLVVANPAVGVEYKVVDSLLLNGRVECDFHVPNRLGIIRSLDVLGGPVAWHDTRKFPAGASDQVRVGIIINCVNERFERNVMTKSVFAIGSRYPILGQRAVVGSDHVEDRAVKRQEVSLGGGLVEDFSPKAGTGCVQGIAARHSESDRPVSRDLGEQVNTLVVGPLGLGQVAVLQAGTRMVNGMDINAEPFLEPFCQQRVVGIYTVSHDAYRGPSVNLLEPLQDGTQVGFVTPRIPHVINGQHNDCLDAGFADPLGRR